MIHVSFAAFSRIGSAGNSEICFVGMKSRGVYETPGGTILRVVHRGQKPITLYREVMRIRESLVPHYSETIYDGFWFSPEREYRQSTMDAYQSTINGVVKLKLYKVNCLQACRKSDQSLYHKVMRRYKKTTYLIRRTPVDLFA